MPSLHELMKAADNSQMLYNWFYSVNITFDILAVQKYTI